MQNIRFNIDIMIFFELHWLSIYNIYVNLKRIENELLNCFQGCLLQGVHFWLWRMKTANDVYFHFCQFMLCQLILYLSSVYIQLHVHYCNSWYLVQWILVITLTVYYVISFITLETQNTISYLIYNCSDPVITLSKNAEPRYYDVKILLSNYAIWQFKKINPLAHIYRHVSILQLVKVC